jgi:hypothetical protein
MGFFLIEIRERLSDAREGNRRRGDSLLLVNRRHRPGSHRHRSSRGSEQSSSGWAPSSSWELSSSEVRNSCARAMNSCAEQNRSVERNSYAARSTTAENTISAAERMTAGVNIRDWNIPKSGRGTDSFAAAAHRNDCCSHRGSRIAGGCRSLATMDERTRAKPVHWCRPWTGLHAPTGDDRTSSSELCERCHCVRRAERCCARSPQERGHDPWYYLALPTRASGCSQIDRNPGGSWTGAGPPFALRENLPEFAAAAVSAARPMVGNRLAPAAGRFPNPRDAEPSRPGRRFEEFIVRTGKPEAPRAGAVLAITGRFCMAREGVEIRPRKLAAPK